MKSIYDSEEWVTLKLLLLLFLLLCLIGTASATNISAGHVSDYSLDSAGTTYLLTGDILATTTAFSITANDIVFDGNGHIIDCGLTGTGVGIKSNGKNNITIKNVVIAQHDSGSSSHGILLLSCENAKIVNCKVSSVGGAGIYLNGNTAIIDSCNTTSVSGKSVHLITNNSLVTNCTAVSASFYGLGLANSYNNTITSFTARSDSSHGIDLATSNNNYFSKCSGYSNISHGIDLTSCKYNTFIDSIGYTNSTTSGDGAYLSDSSSNVFKNVTASSCMKTGFYLNNMTMYNSFVNCTGESYGKASIYNGIWFAFPLAACAGTNSYTDFISHSKLVTTCKDPHVVKFLVIGDSITAGSATGLPYGAYAYYANISLGSSYAFYNVGLAHETADKGRLRFVDEVAAYKPKYVSIMYGANDLPAGRAQQSIIDDIMWMAAKAKAAGATPIILLTPTRRGFEAKTTALDQNLSTQAIAAGYHVFNMYDIIDKTPNNGRYDAYNATNYLDSVHPTQVANKVIGDAFAKYVAALNSQEGLLPSAMFSANVSSGYVPLDVQFTDLSEDEIGRKWDFGDGDISTEQYPVHTYSTVGSYTINLTAINENGTALKTAIVVVSQVSEDNSGINGENEYSLIENNSESDISDSSHSSSSSSVGGGGGSAEPHSNVWAKKIS
jgi:PKD repeat protein